MPKHPLSGVRCDECNEVVNRKDIKYLDLPRGLEIKVCPSCYKKVLLDGS